MAGPESRGDMEHWAQLYHQLGAKINSFHAVTSPTETHIATRLADINLESARAMRRISKLNAIDPKERERAAKLCVSLRIGLQTLRYYIGEVSKGLEKLEEELYEDDASPSDSTNDPGNRNG